MQNILDKADLKIISLLVERGRIKRSELSEAVGLSIPSISERIDKMQRHGVIRRYSAIVDTKKLGYDIIAFIRVDVESSKYYSLFIKEIQNIDEIIECYTITGEGSYLLKIITKNTLELENLLLIVQSWKGVNATRTSLVLSEVKYTHAKPSKDTSQIVLS